MAQNPVSSVPLARAEPPEGSIAGLVQQAQLGHRKAFETLYRRLKGAVHAVVFAHAGRSDASDLVQEVFMSGWSHLSELREPEAFAGWILGIARRRAIDARRKSQRHGASVELADAMSPALPVPTPEVNEALNAIATLPDAYRETLLMRLIEGMTGPEIAAVTGMTPESVRVNLCRGMKLLREKLDGIGGAT